MFNKPSRLVDRVFLHCSASDHASHDNVATMDRWHKERGWSGVGYHLFIRKDGTLENGRSLNKTPAAQAGHNKGTIAICCHGLDKKKFTAAQMKTLKKLCVEINNAYGGAITFHGHREVASKACPVFDYKDVLELDRFGRLGLSGAEVQDTIDSDSRSANKLPTIRRGDRGSAVALLQQQLLLKDDGIFGPKTEMEVKAFHESHGLTRDGVVGSKTWAKILDNDRIEHIGD